MFTGRETILLLVLFVTVFACGYFSAKTKELYLKETKTLNKCKKGDI